jgi:hypothetical protein
MEVILNYLVQLPREQNMAIRGGDSGGLDGIDVSATNIWYHDASQFFCKKLLVI